MAEPAKEDAPMQDPPVEVEEPSPEPLDIPVLVLTMSMQRQHGLRHGDFDRYRQFCTRRAQRMRKAADFQHGKKRFQPRQITSELISDDRLLLLQLTLVERAWAQALDDKQKAKESPRRRRHQISRLNKAVKLARQFQELVKESKRCTPRTQTEVQAYVKYMEGTLAFERKHWEQAAAALGDVKRIYHSLLPLVQSDTERSFYSQRCEEIDGSLSFCAYNLKGSNSDIQDLLQMKLHAAGDSLLHEQLESAIVQERAKEASMITSIDWLGRSVPLTALSVRVPLSQSRGIQKEMEQAPPTDFDEVMGTYDNLFIQYGEALGAIAAEMEAVKKTAGQHLSETDEEALANLQFTRAYVLQLRLRQTVERNMRMVRRSIDAYQEGSARPEDLMRLYDIILQNYSEMNTIEILQDDPDFLDESEAHTLCFQALRCYYIAEHYRLAQKLPQALALFERCVDRAVVAKTKTQRLTSDSAGLNKELLGNLDDMMRSVRAHRCGMQAKHFLQASTESAPQGNVLEEPHMFRQNPAILEQNLVAFPPSFEAIACKPLFFDLAGNHVSYPSLKHRLAADKPKKEASKAKVAKEPEGQPRQSTAAAAAATKEKEPAEEAAAGGVTGMFKSIAGGWWGSK